MTFDKTFEEIFETFAITSEQEHQIVILAASMVMERPIYNFCTNDKQNFYNVAFSIENSFKNSPLLIAVWRNKFVPLLIENKESSKRIFVENNPFIKFNKFYKK